MKLSNQVSSPSLFDKSHGRSKAQMSLKKILDFISSHSSSSLVNIEFVESEAKVETKVLSYGKRGFDIDLNLRLGLCFESENENKGFSACSGVGEDDGGRVCGIAVNCTSSVVFGDVSMVDKSSEGECDPKEVLKSVVVEDETRESSDITNLQVISSEIEAKQTCEDEQQEEVEAEVEQPSQLVRRRESKSEGYLDLLVEAARLISRKDEEDQTNGETQSIREPIRLESRGNEEKWMVDGFEDISPIVRSKRGRNQVLPYRYRDSVLEPWKTLTSTKKRSSRLSAAKQRTK